MSYYTYVVWHHDRQQWCGHAHLSRESALPCANSLPGSMVARVPTKSVPSKRGVTAQLSMQAERCWKEQFSLPRLRVALDLAEKLCALEKPMGKDLRARQVLKTAIADVEDGASLDSRTVYAAEDWASSRAAEMLPHPGADN